MPTTASGIALWDQVNSLVQDRQRQANAGRIPNAAELEAQSSFDIEQLLNPPGYFADTDRQAAELGAMRGTIGSPAANSAAVRMTDQERLKRIALGQEMLTAALGRNPTAPLPDTTHYIMSPYQQAQLQMAQERWNLERARLTTPSVTYSGSPGWGGRTGLNPATASSLDSAVQSGTITRDQARQMADALVSGGAGGAAPATAVRGGGPDLYDTTTGYLPLSPGGPTPFNPATQPDLLSSTASGGDGFFNWLVGGDQSGGYGDNDFSAITDPFATILGNGANDGGDGFFTGFEE